MKYLFYAANPEQKDMGALTIDVQYRWTLWKPSLSSIVPDRFSFTPFTVWWTFHHLHIFSSSDYGILIVHKGETLVHRSCVFPRYFRFPFMTAFDLQIGDIWTAPAHRGGGLATFAIEKIIELHQRPGREFWFVVEDNNKPSIRAAEKAGFKKFGEGIRTKRFGMKVFGAYVILENSFKTCNSYDG